MPLPRVLLVNSSPHWGGIGRYTRELDRALRALSPPTCELSLLHQNVAGRTVPTHWRSPEDREGLAAVEVQPRPWWAKQRGHGTVFLINSLTYFPHRVPRGFDLYHFTSQVLGAGVRHVPRAVVTVHDLVAFHVPTNHRAIPTWLRRRHFSALLQARGLVFISEYSRQDFLARFDYPDERTTVVHHGVGDGFQLQERLACRESLGLPLHAPILLHVGSEERRKNVETLLKAVARLVRRYPNLLLVRVGGGSSRSRRLIERHDLNAHVRYLPALTDAQVAASYAAADLFVFPSYFEGFGLPILEAMRSGCPVLAANATSIPEVTGDAAMLVDPMDESGLAASIDALLADPARREGLRQRGLERAAEFTWKRTALQTAEAYRRALAAG